MNYHRIMLHMYLWVLRLAELNNQRFAPIVQERIQKAAMFILRCQDAQTGRVPNYGQNDGALIFPLTDCQYQDFRPIIQACHYYFRRNRCYAAGPWDELLYWFFGEEALNSKVVPYVQESSQAKAGGYFVIKSTNGFVFTRCPARFYHRPSQADILTVDLWWQGVTVL